MVQISAAEALVMEILWRNHPLAADEVVAALADRDWAEATVKTLLNRLLNKGAIGAEKDGRRYLYSPQVAREDWVLEEATACSSACSMVAWRHWWRVSASTAD